MLTIPSANGRAFLSSGRALVFWGLMLLLGSWVQPVMAIEADQGDAGFNHLSTGFPLRGAHERLACETCHIHGIFKGTPTRCSACHGRSTEMEASKKPATHIPTVQECDLCHNDALSNVSWQLARMDHLGIVNNCAMCHDNRRVEGKNPTHIPTSSPCETCHHSFATFADAIGFDHSELARNPRLCRSCHNGQIAEGPVSPHIPQRGFDCGDVDHGCHNTPKTTTGDWFVRWGGAEHTAYGGNLNPCGTCHLLVRYADIQQPEPPPGRPGPHTGIATIANCDQAGCHSGALAAGSFRITTAANDRSNYKGVLRSLADKLLVLFDGLIGKAEAADLCLSYTKANTDVCALHENAVTISKKPCADCHIPRFGAVSKSDAPSPGHIPSSDVCQDCHKGFPTAADTAKTTFADKTTMNHTGITSGCSKCHGFSQQLFPSVKPSYPSISDAATSIVIASDAATPPGHVANPLNFDCSVCHTKASVPSGNGWFDIKAFQFAVMNHGKMKNQCQSCHGNAATAKGQAQATTKYPNGFHVDALDLSTANPDCALCHKASIGRAGGVPNATPNGWRGGQWDHSVTYPGSAAKVNCKACHADGASNATSTPSSFVIPGTTTSRHIDVGTAGCETCHAASFNKVGAKAKLNFKSWAGGIMDSARHTAAGLTKDSNCAGCHNGIKALDETQFVKRIKGKLQSVHMDIVDPSSGDAKTKFSCEQCHQPTTGTAVSSSWANGTLTPAMHLTLKIVSANPPTATDTCAKCHDGVQARGPRQPVPFPNGSAYPHLPIPLAGTKPADCVACHKSAFDQTDVAHPWGGAAWSHVAYQGDRSVKCESCHYRGGPAKGPTQAVLPQFSDPPGFPHIHVQSGKKTLLPCLTCHNPLEKPAPFDITNPGNGDWAGGVMGSAEHVAMKATKNCSTCHGAKAVGSDGKQTNNLLAAGTKGPDNGFNNHVDVGNLSCEQCHKGTQNLLTSAVAGKTITGARSDWSEKPVKMNHKGTSTTNCQSCHDGVKASGVDGPADKPFHHLPLELVANTSTSKEDCSKCHSASITRDGFYSDWTKGRWDHVAQASTDCVACHGAQTSVSSPDNPSLFERAAASGATQKGDHNLMTDSFGKALLHIPTVIADSNGTRTGEQACDICHTASKLASGKFAAYTRWSGAVMKTSQHVAVDATKNCISCHDGIHGNGNGTFVKGKPNDLKAPYAHIPSSEACELCHAPTPAIAARAAVSNVPPGTGSRAIPALPAVTFESFKFARVPHIAATLGVPADSSGTPASCKTCHETKLAKGMGDAPAPGHIPFVVDGVETNCSGCHATDVDGTHDDKKSGHQFKPAGMVHKAVGIGTKPTGQNNCTSCHSGKYRAVGSFKGTYGKVDTVKLKGHEHIPTTLDCDACHIPETFEAPFHVQTDKGCASCHNGKIATGKGPDHVQTSEPCESCHLQAYQGRLTSGALGGFPRDPNGSYAIEPYDKTAGWQGAGVNHRTLTATSSCSNAGCHDGKSPAPAGKPKVHMPNPASAATVDCGVCHLVEAKKTIPTGSNNPTTWVNTGTVDHAGLKITTSCERCHTATFTQDATGYGTDANSPEVKPEFPNAPHIPNPTKADCAVCHQASILGAASPVAVAKFGSWKLGKFHGASVVPDSQVKGACNQCHNGVRTSGSAYVFGDGTTYDGTKYLKSATSFVQATAAQRPFDLSDVASTRPHIFAGSGSGVTTCDQCHNSTSTFNSNLVPLPHSSAVLSATGGCAKCHGNVSGTAIFAGNTAINTTPTSIKGFGNAAQKVTDHIDTAQNCDVCHGATQFSSFKIAKTPASATMNHAGITNNCASCHLPKTGPTTTQFKQTKLGSTVVQTVVGTPLNHIPDPALSNSANKVTPCEQCHNATVFTSFSGTAMNHVVMNSAGAVVKMTTGCSTCHGDPQTTFVGNQKPLTKLNPGKTGFTHITSGNDCEVCHKASITSNNYTSWAGGAFNHVDGQGNTYTTGCSAGGCHDGKIATGKTWPDVTFLKGPNSSKPFNHVPINPSGTAWGCEKCHQASITRKFDNFSGGLMGNSGGHAALGMTTGASSTTYCKQCHVRSDAATTYAAAPNNAFTMPATPAWPGSAAHIPVLPLGSAATNPPINPPTNDLPCGTCHRSFSAFSGAIMGVDGHKGLKTGTAATVDQQCVKCHDNGTHLGMQVIGKAFLPNHDTIAKSTSNKCESCHTSFTSFFYAGFDHSGIGTARCDSCHGNSSSATPATGLMSGHIPVLINSTTAKTDCKSCHQSAMTAGNGWPTKPVSFTGGVVDHIALGVANPTSGSVTQCSSCHNGSYLSSNALGVSSSVNHLPIRFGTATADVTCDKCHAHTSASDFNSFAVISAAFHQTAGVDKAYCSTCHTGGIFAGQHVTGVSADHLPLPIKVTSGTTTSTSNACEQCHWTDADTGHTAELANFSTAKFTGVKMSDKHHAGRTIKSGCADCHNGTVYAVTTQGKDKASVAATYSGKTHVATTAACETCHQASFTGVAPAPNGNDYVDVTGKPGWSGGLYDHTKPTLLTTGCIGCHDGKIQGAKGASAYEASSGKSHVAMASGQACEQCHLYSLQDTTNKYKLWSYNTTYPYNSMNHTGLTTGCASCHDTSNVFAAETNAGASGTITATNKSAKASALGTSINHVQTTQACETCHMSTAIGAIPNPTAANTANTTLDGFWKKAGFDHTTLPATNPNCASCHDGKTASGMPTGHDLTNSVQKACETCHQATRTARTIGGASVPAYSQKAWQGGVMDHTGVTSKCASCHDGTVWTTQNAYTTTIVLTSPPVFQATMTPLHVGSVPSGKGTHLTIANTETRVPHGCESCHQASMLTATGVWKNRTVTGSDTQWVGGQYDHLDHTATPPTAALSTKCEDCHKADGSIAGASGKVVTTSTSAPYKHVDTGTVTGCEGCHVASISTTVTNAPNKYLTWAGGKMLHASAGKTSACQTCHGSGTGQNGPFQGNPGVGSVPSKKTASHVITPDTGSGSTLQSSDCVVCHKSPYSTGTARSDFGNWTGGVYHSVTVTWATTPRCDVCHNGSITGTGGTALTTKATTHIPTILGTSTTADNCDVCHDAPTGAPPFPTTKWQLPTITLGTGAITYGSGHKMMHIDAAGNAISTGCSACHDNSTVFQGYSSTTAAAKRPMLKAAYASHQTTTSDCSACHQSSVVSATAGSAIKGVYTTWAGGGVSHATFTAATTCTGSGCHGKTNSSSTTSPRGPDSDHIPLTITTGATTSTTGQDKCGACHSKALTGSPTPTGWTNTGIMDHTSIGITDATTCTTCHKNPTAATFSAGKAKPAGISTAATQHVGFNHLDVTSTTNCTVCHTGRLNTGLAAGIADGTDWTGSGIYHKSTIGQAVTTCVGCHENGLAKPVLGYDPAKSWGFGVQNRDSYTATVGGVANTKIHIPTAAPIQSGCEKCHAGSISGGYLTWATGVMSHSGISITAPGVANVGCKTCHNKILAMGYPVNTKIASIAHPDHEFKTETPYSTWSGTLTTSPLPNIAGMACEVCHMSQTVGSKVTDPASATAWKVTKTSPNQCKVWHVNSAIAGSITVKANDTGGNHTGVSTCWYCHYGSGQAGSNNTWGAQSDGAGQHSTPYKNKSQDCYGSCHEHSVNSLVNCNRNG